MSERIEFVKYYVTNLDKTAARTVLYKTVQIPKPTNTMEHVFSIVNECGKRAWQAALVRNNPDNPLKTFVKTLDLVLLWGPERLGVFRLHLVDINPVFGVQRLEGENE